MARDFDDFYDPRVPQAGAIAERYSLSVSDVVGMLLVAGGDEALVRQVLAESNNSPEAKDAKRHGKLFDLVAHAKPRLQQIMSERKAQNPKP